MLINNPEALKSWLIVVLEPLCDADSSALARYVLALLKKDKPENELKHVMIEQLDVFLGEETKPFVERLFDAINSEEYLVIPPPPPPPPAVTQQAADGSIRHIAIGGSVDLETNASLNTDFISEEAKVNLLPSTVVPTTTTTTTNIHKELPTPQNDETRTKDMQNNHKASDVAESATHHHNTHHSTASSASSQQHHVRSASPPPTRTTVNAADKENQPRESRRRRTSLRSRSRSRSRSNERSRRSRSRDRRANNGDRDKGNRQFRNKSPPSLDTRHDRRRGMGGSGGTGDRRNRLGGPSSGMGVDERSPRFVGGSGGGGGGGGAIDNNRKMRSNRSHSRSRSPSAERINRNKISPGNALRNSPDRHQQAHVQAQSEKRQRCRDFDEKGYCVRGETCPWDHGVNPVVFEDINNAGLISISLREYNPDAPDLWTRTAPPGTMVAGGTAGLGGGVVGVGVGAGGINPFTGTPRSGAVMMGVGAPNTVGFPHLAGAGVDKVPNGAAALAGADYARTAAAGAGFRTAAAPMIPFPFNPVATPLQRELIPIPVVDANTSGGVGMGVGVGVGVGVGGVGGDIGAALQQQQGKRRFELEDTVAIADGPTKRKLPLNSRLGPRISNIQTNCSLELRKVPRGLNTIAHLNNHFAKFGKIVNIQISYDGDPEAAIVTFSTHAEANVAYRSTEAVLNNRFIKVFWHSADVSGGGGIGGINDGSHMSMAGGRKSSQYHLNNVPAVPTPAADSAKTANTAANANASSQGGGGDTPNSAGAADATMAMNTMLPPPSSSAATTATAANTNATSVSATHVPNPSLRLKNNVARSIPASGGNGANNASIIRKKQEEQAKAVVQLANGLRKRKQELLQSYVKQMKSALELVERCEPQDAQRVKTLETIKVLQENIDKMRKEIAAEQEQLQSRIQNNQAAGGAAAAATTPTTGGGVGVGGHQLQQQSSKKTKEQQKKELLDIELELFAQQQEGNDTSAIQKRLEELQRSLGIAPSGGAIGVGGAPGGGVGMPVSGKTISSAHFMGNHRANNPRGRATFPEGSTRVDRRPKTIVVTGFTSEEADFVLGHFKHFGEISKHNLDKDIPQLILSYATRISAEQAVLRGKIFKDKRLQIYWAPTVAPKLNLSTNTPVDDSSKSDVDKMSSVVDIVTSPIIGPSKSLTDLDLGADTLPELRLEDEEEDDECEDRSWRR